MRRLCLLVLLTVALAGVPATATAEGEPDLLLSVPGTGRLLAVGKSEPPRGSLAALVGDVRTARPEGGPGGRVTGGPGVTLTWLDRDDRPRRVDRILVFGRHDIWIGTRFAPPGRPVGQGRQAWHRPDRPAMLFALLDGLGLAGPAMSPPSFPSAAGWMGADARPRTVQPARAEDTAGDGASSGVGSGTPDWLLPALLVLLLGGFGLLGRRVPRTETGPENGRGAGAQDPDAEVLDWPPRSR